MVHSVLHQQPHRAFNDRHMHRASGHVEIAHPSNLKYMVDINDSGRTHRVGTVTYQYYPTHVTVQATEDTQETNLSVTIVVTPDYLHAHANAQDGRLGELKSMKFSHDMGVDIYDAIAPNTIVDDEGREQVIAPVIISNTINAMFEGLHLRDETSSENLSDFYISSTWTRGKQELKDVHYVTHTLRTDNHVQYRYKVNEWEKFYEAALSEAYLSPSLFDDATVFAIPQGLDDEDLRKRLDALLSEHISPKTKASVAKHINSREVFQHLDAKMAMRIDYHMRDIIDDAERAYCHEDETIDNMGRLSICPKEGAENDQAEHAMERFSTNPSLRPHTRTYRACMEMLRRTPTRLTDGAEYVDEDAITTWRQLESSDEDWQRRWNDAITRVAETNYANQLQQLDDDRIALEDLILEKAAPSVFKDEETAEDAKPVFRDTRLSVSDSYVLNHNNPFAHASTSKNVYTHISEEGVRDLRLTEVEQITHQVVDGQSLAITKPSLRVIDTDIDIEIGDNVLAEHRYKLEWRE